MENEEVIGRVLAGALDVSAGLVVDLDRCDVLPEWSKLSLPRSSVLAGCAEAANYACNRRRIAGPGRRAERAGSKIGLGPVKAAVVDVWVSGEAGPLPGEDARLLGFELRVGQDTLRPQLPEFLQLCDPVLASGGRRRRWGRRLRLGWWRVRGLLWGGVLLCPAVVLPPANPV
jgi:hypothetical protein